MSLIVECRAFLYTWACMEEPQLISAMGKHYMGFITLTHEPPWRSPNWSLQWANITWDLSHWHMSLHGGAPIDLCNGQTLHGLYHTDTWASMEESQLISTMGKHYMGFITLTHEPAWRSPNWSLQWANITWALSHWHMSLHGGAPIDLCNGQTLHGLYHTDTWACMEELQLISAMGKHYMRFITLTHEPAWRSPNWSLQWANITWALSHWHMSLHGGAPIDLCNGQTLHRLYHIDTWACMEEPQLISAMGKHYMGFITLTHEPAWRSPNWSLQWTNIT